MAEIINEIISADLLLTEPTESSEEAPIEKQAKKRGRHISNPDRWLANGKYNHKPTDPEYFKKYYHVKFGHSYTCEICGGVLASTQKIQRHQNSKKCQNKSSILQHLVA